jgi:hypothetical protein
MRLSSPSIAVVDRRDCNLESYFFQVGDLWKSSGLESRVGESSIDNEVELAPLAGANFHRAKPAALYPNPHTESFGLIASGSAIKDDDCHGVFPFAIIARRPRT